MSCKRAKGTFCRAFPSMRSLGEKRVARALAPASPASGTPQRVASPATAARN